MSLPSKSGNTTTLDLALEGERLCKGGDFRSGVAFFEAAIQSGTEDLKTLSAIYSQIGNAYFFLGDYTKAVLYHRNDLTLARTMSDKLGEAKASGNLGNTLKLMGKFDEAILCCRRHLELAGQLDDPIGTSRALYNLANAYHAKGKSAGRLGQQDPGEFPPDVKECLESAKDFYGQNLNCTRKLKDRQAEGRACGNLGNVHYLMGDFEEAIRYHELRLEIAKEFNDLNAQRRAFTNLGNAMVFSGEFEGAVGYYKSSLSLSQSLSDRCIEAQACYSLGNTYTLLRNYPLAIEYHLRHLQIAQQLSDKVGQGRAYWSLGNAHSAMGEHRKALEYARRHGNVCREVGDAVGEATARMNVTDLKRVLGEDENDEDDSKLEEKSSRRKSMQEMKLFTLKTPDSKSKRSYSLGNDRQLLNLSTGSVGGEEEEEEEDAFFDMLTKVQANRLDDQRCEIKKKNCSRAMSLPGASCHGSQVEVSSGVVRASSPSDLLDLIWGAQSHRMNEQRATLPSPTLATTTEEEGEDEFLEMLMKCQSSRLDSQRTELAEGGGPPRAMTVPDEDFFSLIARIQDKRMDDQRVELSDKNRNVL